MVHTLLEDARPVYLDNARVVLILLVEAHTGRDLAWKPLPERHEEAREMNEQKTE